MLTAYLYGDKYQSGVRRQKFAGKLNIGSRWKILKRKDGARGDFDWMNSAMFLPMCADFRKDFDGVYDGGAMV